MTTTAIIMMIITLVAIWGGLGAAIISLRRHPEQPESDTDEFADSTPEPTR